MKPLHIFNLALALSLTSGALWARSSEEENSALFTEGLPEIINLSQIKAQGLDSGETKLDLWSGSYWPIFQGGLAVRYRDQDFIKLIKDESQWDKFYELYQRKPLYAYAGTEGLLSPAEKYDLLIGDKEMSLTNYAWENGQKNMILTKVPTWRGICDGWASASQKMPRPKKSVTKIIPDGRSLTFFPEDIKALGSLLYARAQEKVLFIGKRCISRAFGLFTNACDETNPATFHKALANRVGKLQKTFISDVSPGSEVWNYPVKNYKFTYFNVFTKEESDDFKTVMENFSEGRRFRKELRRSPSTRYIVGVKAVVNYMDMREANLLETDDATQDKLLEMVYRYDLELDRNFNLIGGESISRDLPDFIWAPNDGTYPLSISEKKGPLQESQLMKASQESARKGQPLSLIVKDLFESAK